MMKVLLQKSLTQQDVGGHLLGELEDLGKVKILAGQVTCWPDMEAKEGLQFGARQGHPSHLRADVVDHLHLVPVQHDPDLQ